MGTGLAGKGIDCREMQKKYIPFIDDELGERDLEMFLAHLEECPDCREEYDIYYTMIAGTRYLEDDTVRGWVDSGEKLLEAQDYLRRCRFVRWMKVAVLVVLCIGCMLVLA